jgi:hypothetical protein
VKVWPTHLTSPSAGVACDPRWCDQAPPGGTCLIFMNRYGISMNYAIVNTTEGVPKLLQGDVCETEFSHIESCNKKQVEELIKLKSIIKIMPIYFPVELRTFSRER